MTTEQHIRYMLSRMHIKKTPEQIEKFKRSMRRKSLEKFMLKHFNSWDMKDLTS